MIKNLKVIGIAAILGIGMVSCGSDDDSNDSSPSLQGTWRISSQIFNGENIVLGKCSQLHTIDFSGSVFTSMIYGGEDCSEVDKVVASFTSTDSSFTTSAGNVVGTVEIIELTKTMLDVRLVDTESVIVEISYLRQ